MRSNDVAGTRISRDSVAEPSLTVRTLSSNREETCRMGRTGVVVSGEALSASTTGRSATAAAVPAGWRIAAVFPAKAQDGFTFVNSNEGSSDEPLRRNASERPTAALHVAPGRLMRTIEFSLQCRTGKWNGQTFPSGGRRRPSMVGSRKRTGATRTRSPMTRILPAGRTHLAAGSRNVPTGTPMECSRYSTRPLGVSCTPSGNQCASEDGGFDEGDGRAVPGDRRDRGRCRHRRRIRAEVAGCRACRPGWGQLWWMRERGRRFRVGASLG